MKAIFQLVVEILAAQKRWCPSDDRRGERTSNKPAPRDLV
jgi:hypothetical protein